ncbi:MAG TPA: hypothetical protein VHX11_09025 [Acidobacteriaceae bacterium]|jgi:hypothetical protein|nr:hypothetical protein [Acidobacteriaceae bacterium]
MSETKHTPGPWSRYNEERCSNIFLESHCHGSVCKIANNLHAEANARLIAAAPELLEALERLIARAGENLRGGMMWSEITQAKAAIRKAKGE